MDKPMIGIRQADGSFYEIVGDAQAARKRLVLSAARTDQHGVKIDLYRSVNGTLEGASSLGEITLDDPEGLGYQDIEFRVDVDAEGQLQASAALPGQSPRVLSVDLSQFRGPRTDADILAADSVPSEDLDNLGDDFTLDPEPMTLDLPEIDDLPPLSFDDPTPRTDAEILSDEGLASAEIDDLGDFGDFEADPDPGIEPEPVARAASPGPAPAEPETFDLGDLDAGFGADEPVAPADEPSDAPPAEEWEKISLDNMESLEFMDTGDQISTPRTMSKPAAPQTQELEDFRMDDDAPLELNDLESDLSDLPGLGDMPPPSLDDLDHDFLAPPALTESTEEPETVPPKSVKSKAAREPKRPSSVRSSPDRETPATLDKLALFLSLATLSLLVLLILVLLFLNMIKAPQVPAVQPEVMRWKPVATVSTELRGADLSVDLGSATAPTFQAGTVLEVPQGLRTARISLRLQPGETVVDAERRFGALAQNQGNLLLW